MRGGKEDLAERLAHFYFVHKRPGKAEKAALIVGKFIEKHKTVEASEAELNKSLAKSFGGATLTTKAAGSICTRLHQQ